LPKSPALALSSALAALLMIPAGWMIWQKMERTDGKPEVAQMTPSPTAPVVTVSPSQNPEGAAVIARLNDGNGQVTLDADGNLSGINHLYPVYSQMIKDALISQRLEESPLLAGLVRRDDISTRGGDSQGVGFSVISPVGKVALSDRPTFRWSPLEGATGYVVEVYDDNLNQIVSSSKLTGTSWTATQSLKRGVIYSWQVTAIKDGEEYRSPHAPAPQANFRILDETLAHELAQARRAYASSHLTLALVYTRVGALDEAEREFRALIKANPNSKILRRLLANLRTMRR
jgi:hypothetical protein